MVKVLILNGPNLDQLGVREPEVYGDKSLADIEQLCHQFAAANNLEVDFRQSNKESDLIEWLHEATASNIPVIINPAAFTHTSVAIRDAAAALKAPLIEIHISNPISREEFRHTSYISGIARGTISGFGVNSYTLALQALSHL